MSKTLDEEWLDSHVIKEFIKKTMKTSVNTLH